jgi:tetratricopeptide (TPR) repeat protein
MTRNQSQVPRHVVLFNRQSALWDKVREVTAATHLSQAERIVRLKEFLGQQPNASVRRKIYEGIFTLAVKSGQATEVREYGRRLHLMDPYDSALLSQMALVLADKRTHLAEALSWARQAVQLTATFRRAWRPPNTSQRWVGFLFPEEKQRAQYKIDRARALDALGWTLTQMRQPQAAEPWLRQAIEIERSEIRLSHLARVLQMQGRKDEATLLQTEAFFEDHLSEAGQYLDLNGVGGKAQYIKVIIENNCTVTTYSLDNTKVTMLSDDVALLTYRYAHDAVCGGNREASPLWASTLYVKRVGKWLIAFHQEIPAA